MNGSRDGLNTPQRNQGAVLVCTRTRRMIRRVSSIVAKRTKEEEKCRIFGTPSNCLGHRQKSNSQWDDLRM